jgi:uncharacterized membrane protein
MNYAHLHLILNHIPIVALPLATAFLLFAFVKKNQQMKKFSLVVLVLIGLVTLPVYFTGEPAEHMLDGVPSVTEDVIEPHEEMGEKALIISLIASALAVSALVIVKDEKRNQQLVVATLLVAIFGSMALGYTGYTGGKIRHTEART